MAVDTRDKRSGAIGAARPWMARLPVADTMIDQGDRRCLAYSYCGSFAITIDSTTIAGPGLHYTLGLDGRIDYTLPIAKLNYTVPLSRIAYTFPNDDKYK